MRRLGLCRMKLFLVQHSYMGKPIRSEPSSLWSLRGVALLRSYREVRLTVTTRMDYREVNPREQPAKIVSEQVGELQLKGLGGKRP